MSNELSKSNIGLRAQEFHEGLKDITAFGLKEAYLEKTILIGKAASLATHLKGLSYYDNVPVLAHLAAELGITRIELRPVLQVLEEVDFATVLESGTEIKRIDLRIPELRDGYKDLGEKWTLLKPGEIEHAALYMLDDVASFPRNVAEVKNKLRLGDKEFNIVLALGSEGVLVNQYEHVDGETILYSPLTVEEKPDALLTLAQNFSEDRIVVTLNEVQALQGMPLDLLKGSSRELVIQAVSFGVLYPVRIIGGTQERVFLFTPRGGLHKEERVILEKARAILACVRYGEHYSKGTRITNPRRILETLRDRKRFAVSHPNFPEQYGLLVTKQIGRIDEDNSRRGYFNFFLLDTPENLLALDIAIDLLEIGQSPTSKLEVDAKKILNVSGSFSGTLPTRSKIGRNAILSKEISTDIVLKISKSLQGIH